MTCNKVDEIVAGEGEKPVGCQQSSGVEKVRQNGKGESRAKSSRKEPKKLISGLQG